VFLASTNPSDLSVQFGADDYAGLPPFARAVARLPQVRRAGIAVEPIGDVPGPDGGPTAASLAADFGLETVGSVNGLYFRQDRVTVTGGRMADPRNPDQVMISAQAARLLGLRLGESVPMGFYTNAQSESPRYGTPAVRPTVRVAVQVVGLIEFSNTVVQDDIDRPLGYLVLTPALTRTLLAAGTSSGISFYGLQLDHGARDVPAVEREINNMLPVLGSAQFHVTSVNEAQAQSAIEPDWIALAAFAVIAAVAALLISGPAIARPVRASGQRPGPDRPRPGHPRAAAQAPRRHGGHQLREPHPGPAHDRGHGHHASRRAAAGAAHLDGHRSAGPGRAPRPRGRQLRRPAGHGVRPAADRGGRHRGPGFPATRCRRRHPGARRRAGQ
jgi:hypothetical protein